MRPEPRSLREAAAGEPAIGPVLENGQVRAPYAAFKLMRILRGRELPGEAWKGWTVSGHTLWSPAGQRFDRAGMEYLGLVFSIYRTWRKAREVSL